ncbi:hypothetical protein L1994_08720 [Methanomicrobium antiquum]|uniref:Uncharacterized protein n=1 Tax=Methanomicrobium antiquum TaxID=487686 RepID=A0AAF0FLT0_9EURY|nr:hypothetical protein [Methanomicrobium antiquum]WFN36225.1 hypothetical protein L1994_08720 [Methanomicrobium antiquum]
MKTDDSAILSVDFLAGFTIFLVALIFVINMMPGLLIGVHSSGVDYNAVAYRTSVILAEDPGSPVSPSWELFDEAHKDEIQRLGLSVSSDTPNILSTEKIRKFFNIFDSRQTDDFKFSMQDYRDMAIFGDIPYSFNISLKEVSKPALYTGEPVPKSEYGYMKRLVKVKHYSSADLSGGDLNKTGVNLPSVEQPHNYDCGISFTMKYSELFDKTISPAYRIDPKNEPLMFKITDFSQSLNSTDVKYVTLDKVRFVKDGVEISMPYETIDNKTYFFTIDGVQYNMTPSPPVDMSDKSEIEFELMPTLMFSSEITSTLALQFNFSYEFETNSSNYPIEGEILYSYNSPHITDPYLTDAVMEVCIW